MRRPPLASLAVTLLSVSCSSGDDSYSRLPAAPSGPIRVKLTVMLRVANVRYGTALPSDFTLSVKGAEAWPSRFPGDADGTLVVMDLHAPYEITAEGPDGYAASASAACSGSITGDDQPTECVVSQTELPVTCDPALWEPTYDRDRLRVLDRCQVGTGVVDRHSFERDGDLVVLIKPDPASERLLRPGNIRQLKGLLVVEVPCQGHISQDNAIGTCDRFLGKQIKVPERGTRIVAAAPWVEDRNHDRWGELHGAKIIVLPR